MTVTSNVIKMATMFEQDKQIYNNGQTTRDGMIKIYDEITSTSPLGTPGLKASL